LTCYGGAGGFACVPEALPFLCENRGVQNYAVVINEDPDGGFWGEVPALPGCYSQGETIDELKDNIREAAGVLDVLKEQGREPDA
jgi:predicted RNase H-like HicB family nuclease